MLKENFQSSFNKRYSKLEKRIVRRINKGLTNIVLFNKEWEEGFLKKLNDNLEDFDFRIEECWIPGACEYGYRIKWNLWEV